MFWPWEMKASNIRPANGQPDRKVSYSAQRELRLGYMTSSPVETAITTPSFPMEPAKG
ncbi:MAG: hypothetical protein NXY59_01615 [Aigarchaeota archaeon]|nr:hypothetical protein [Candidatus Pelearchaeum maunauluense]